VNTRISYSDLSDTRHAWRLAGIKGKITARGGNEYRLNIGGEKGRVERHGTKLTLVLHPVNSPAFYAALGLLLDVLGVALTVVPTTLTEPVTVTMPRNDGQPGSAGTQTHFPVDIILLDGANPEPYAGNYARQHLTPPIGSANFFARA
jgi:hypothetical protein